MSGCEAYASQARDLCGEPSVAAVISICACGHTGERRYCAGCAADLQRRDPAWLQCTHCSRSAQPHECPVRVTIRWDSGEVTRAEDGEWMTDLKGAMR